MGGYGSGRTGGYPTSEGCGSYALSAIVLKTIQRQPEGAIGYCSVKWNDGFEVDIHYDRTYPNDPKIELAHYTRDDVDELIRYEVSLTDSFPPMGGRRWWWVCPRSYRTSYKLFLPNGARRFWSRKAYRLGYACQRETDTDRLMRKARKLHRQIGGDGMAIGQGWNPPKPKGMRWNTYFRKLQKWRTADDRANDSWMRGAMRLIGMDPSEIDFDFDPLKNLTFSN